ncbi:MAG: hypothetical protein DMG61_12255 [Acidobacteria bacterium]|nr:MAG: hypothetical protein DMG61_12255 [Acidobacteriota bacterium]PYY16770.1 MAG: hypothetical protein DMG60_13830 [Acidobacteriota bacterium]
MGGDIGGAARGLRLNPPAFFDSCLSDRFRLFSGAALVLLRTLRPLVRGSSFRAISIGGNQNADSTRFRKLWDEGSRKNPGSPTVAK